MINNEFSERLKKLNISYREFAQISQTSASTVEKWYYNLRRTPGIAMAFLDMLELNPAHFKKTLNRLR